MMVEVHLQEISQRLDIHGGLNPVELFLQRVVLLALDKGEDLLSKSGVYGDLSHSQHLGVYSGPSWIWRAQNLSLGGSNHRLLLLLLHLLLQEEHSLLLL